MPASSRIPKNPKYTERDIRAGTRHELEHTRDRRQAKQTAIQHLNQHPSYYQVLPLAEQVMTLRENKGLPKPRHRRKPAPQQSPWGGLPPNWGGSPI